jgi:hypothetical protein
MTYNTWVGTLAEGVTDGTALTNNTSATSILHGSGRAYINPNQFNVGTVIRLTAFGRVSTLATSPGTLTFAFRIGPTSNIVAFASQALALVTVATTNVSWYLEMMLTVRSIGSGTAATIMGCGRFESEINSSGSAGNPTTRLLPASAPAVGTGFDSTVANVADLYATWSALSASNSIQTHQSNIEQLN